MSNKKLGTSVRKQFDNGFILNEEKLRKINSILVSRLGEDNLSENVVFTVFRSDNAKFETDEIEDVIFEENAEWNKITRLTIDYKENEGVVINIDFETSEKSTLEVHGEDRDKVFLLSSDLGTYFSNEVFRPSTKIEVKVLYLIGYLLFIVCFMAFLNNFRSIGNSRIKENRTIQIQKEDAILSSDINTKLNFLIQEAYNPEHTLNKSEPSQVYSLFTTPFFWVLFFGVTFGSFIVNRILYPKKNPSLIDKFFPKYLFLFGKEIEKNKKRQELKDKLFWGILIGGSVSFITGFIVWFLTQKP